MINLFVGVARAREAKREVIDTLGTVLTYNFVIIIGFFLWFLSGAIMQVEESGRRPGGAAS